MVLDGFFHFFSRIFFFTSYVNNNSSFPKPLKPEEEKEYFRRFKEEGDPKAKEILIEHNLRLVAHIVKKYSSSAEVDDLISVGSIGLIKAINSYDPGKGVQLATYTARCIENEILMLIRANKKYKNNISLHEAVGVDREGNELTLMDLISVKERSVIDKVEMNMQIEKFDECLKRVLDEREYKIVCMRYGIGLPRSYTQREVAERMGISRSYISRIEKRALEKMGEEIKKTDLYID